MSLIDLTNVSQLTVIGPEGVAEDGCAGGSCQLDAPAASRTVAERETPRG